MHSFGSIDNEVKEHLLDAPFASNQRGRIGMHIELQHQSAQE
jgi:hypothetical protein